MFSHGPQKVLNSEQIPAGDRRASTDCGMSIGNKLDDSLGNAVPVKKFPFSDPQPFKQQA